MGSNGVDSYYTQRGMMMPLVLALLLMGSAFVGAWYAASPVPIPTTTPTPSVSPMLPEAGNILPLASAAPGALVAEFSMSDYLNAVKTGKVVVLYFYANWCPICAEQFPKFQSAIAGGASSRVAAFRVNFNDSDTDSEEIAAAKTFQVASQYTVVIVRNGKSVYKSNTPVDFAAIIAEHVK